MQPRTANDQQPTTALLASRCEPAEVRVGHAQIFVGIDWNIVDANFIVKMWSSASSAVADVADGIAAVYVLPREYREALEMSVARSNAVSVVKNNGSPVSAHEIREFNDRFGWSDNRLSIERTDVNPGVECAFTVEGVNSLAERPGDRSFYRP